MLVATEKNHGDKPLVIHSNRNQFINDPVKNLSDKEKFVEDLLKSLLKSLQRSYKVIARVYMGKVPSNKEERKDYFDYFVKYYKSNLGLS